MAKLTLSFKDRKLKVFALNSDICMIGRDPACTIVIDSLAIEPRHAQVRMAGDDYSVEAVGQTGAVSVNGTPITEARVLNEGDVIQIGKHSLGFSAEAGGNIIESHITPIPSVGWLQIQNGSHLGRAIRLDKAFTRIGKPECELAVIAHRDDGYYLSALQGEGPEINGAPIGEASKKLDNGDHVLIGELKLQFFADASAAQKSGTPPAQQTDRQQRKFSRIPFDVSATLNDGASSWETSLLDVSLHGALIKAPETLEPRDGQLYQLAIHLEGGPDIRMDVQIAHREDDEIGLDCKDIDVDSITHLRRLVELNLGDPDLLERELSALG